MEAELENLTHVLLERRRHQVLYELGGMEAEVERRRQQGRLSCASTSAKIAQLHVDTPDS